MKNSRSSPVEFTTKRGRKTAKVAYSAYSEDYPELGNEPSTLVSSSPPLSPKLKKNKTPAELPSEIPIKKKRKDLKSKKNELTNCNTNSIAAGGARSPDPNMAPLKIYLTTKIPIPPHQLLSSDQGLYQESAPPSPKILPSSIPLSSILTRPPSPPPRPKATSSRMPINDVKKRINAIEHYIERHQAHLKEHLKSNPRTYKSQKHHYSASTKQAKELLHIINDFNLKLDSL